MIVQKIISGPRSRLERGPVEVCTISICSCCRKKLKESSTSYKRTRRGMRASLHRPASTPVDNICTLVVGIKNKAKTNNNNDNKKGQFHQERSAGRGHHCIDCIVLHQLRWTTSVLLLSALRTAKEQTTAITTKTVNFAKIGMRDTGTIALIASFCINSL